MFRFNEEQVAYMLLILLMQRAKVTRKQVAANLHYSDHELTKAFAFGVPLGFRIKMTISKMLGLTYSEFIGLLRHCLENADKKCIKVVPLKDPLTSNRPGDSKSLKHLLEALIKCDTAQRNILIAKGIYFK